jgi:hypothetical protein
MPTWPHGETKPRRDAQFKSPTRRDGDRWIPGQRIPWDQTLRDLAYEVEALDGADVVIGVGLSEYDIRQDGAPRANARPYSHPGVEISFDSRYGRLTYATDVFIDWRDNVRAVAKGLEALRAVERWGVAKRGQQYAGFALLTAGPSQEDRGRELVARHGGVTAALRATHPDTGGEEASARDFAAVMAFRKAADA